MATTAADSATLGSPGAKLTVGGMPVKGGCASSVSPFVGKLETWLRFAGVEYEAGPGMKMGPKGKVPWIKQGDVYLGDSTFIIQYLKNTYRGQLKIKEELTPMEEAISVACTRICEDHLLFGLVYYRFMDKQGFKSMKDFINSAFPIPFCWFGHFIYSRRARQGLNGQGMGLHSKKDLDTLLLADLKAINGFLGDQNYIAGDEPVDGDAIVFSTLDSFLYDDEGLEQAKLVKQFPNLVRYVDRIRSTYYPPESPSKFKIKK